MGAINEIVAYLAQTLLSVYLVAMLLRFYCKWYAPTFTTR